MAYALQLSENERARYRFMAEGARAEEHRMWAAAGVGSGARVADIGCGPGAVLRCSPRRSVRPAGPTVSTPTPAEIPDLTDLHARYVEFHRAQGNDIVIGQALGSLLETAGLNVESFPRRRAGVRVPAGLWGPAWAARETLVSAGFATTEDVARWEAMFKRMDTLPSRPWIAVAPFVAVGRAPR